jgi:hypothetical protein
MQIDEQGRGSLAKLPLSCGGMGFKTAIVRVLVNGFNQRKLRIGPTEFGCCSSTCRLGLKRGGNIRRVVARPAPITPKLGYVPDLTSTHGKS